MKALFGSRCRVVAAGSVAAYLLALTLAHASRDSAKSLLPDSYRKAGVIRVATEAKYPPFESFASDGKTMVGFEVDLWDEIGKRLGVKMEAVSVAFDSLIPGVQANRWDVAIEAISDNAERQKVVSFVDYGYSTSAAYALAENTEITDDPLSLCGKVGGGQSGTDFLDVITRTLTNSCASAGKPAPRKSEYSSADAVLLALYSKRVDFAITDAASAAQVKEGAGKPIRTITSPTFPRTYNGIAFRKQEQALGLALLAALNEVIEDGTYAKIYAKWGIPGMKLEKAPGINLQVGSSFD